MIIVKVMGGIGNQLFQYALAYTLSKMGRRVKLDLSYYGDNHPEKDTVRKCIVNLLPVKFDEASQMDIDVYNGSGIIKKIRSKLWIDRIIIDNKIYSKDVFKLTNGYFIGYWQSRKYFEKYYEDICEGITDFIYSKVPQDSILAKEISESTCAVALHVRGTDYLDATNKNYLGNVCSREYYLKATEIIQKKCGNVEFYVFSDDMQYARTVIGDIDANFVDVGDDLIELALLSMCRHFIIANSTYSWWGATLGRHDDKIVIAPNTWNSDDSNRDIYNKEMIIV